MSQDQHMVFLSYLVRFRNNLQTNRFLKPCGVRAVRRERSLQFASLITTPSDP